MSPKAKILVLALGCMVALAVSEQLDVTSGTFSRIVSRTSVDIVRKPGMAAELAASNHIERPVTRWLPFVKFGETFYRRTFQDRSENGAIFEYIVTTRTSLWIVGYCSTVRYDKMTDKPFEKARVQYAKAW